MLVISERILLDKTYSEAIFCLSSQKFQHLTVAKNATTTNKQQHCRKFNDNEQKQQNDKQQKVTRPKLLLLLLGSDLVSKVSDLNWW